jgi:hypothetical protein
MNRRSDLLKIAGRAQMEITAGGWMWATLGVRLVPLVCGSLIIILALFTRPCGGQNEYIMYLIIILLGVK